MSSITRQLLGSFQFSTNEQKTGLKWIDGKDIYVKTVSIDSPIYPGAINAPLPSGYETIVDYLAVIDVAGGNNNIVNNYYAVPHNDPYYFGGYTYNGVFSFSVKRFSTINSGKITFFYTKTS